VRRREVCGKLAHERGRTTEDRMVSYEMIMPHVPAGENSAVSMNAVDDGVRSAVGGRKLPEALLFGAEEVGEEQGASFLGDGVGERGAEHIELGEDPIPTWDGTAVPFLLRQLAPFVRGASSASRRRDSAAQLGEPRQTLGIQ
jgi:hypothetical protein